MRWLRLAVMVATCAASAVQANDILEVLHESAQRRLDAMPPAPDGPRAQAVRDRAAHELEAVAHRLRARPIGRWRHEIGRASCRERV